MADDTRTRGYRTDGNMHYIYEQEWNGRLDDVNAYYTHHEPSLGELFSDLSRESSALIREEIRLAQVEMTDKAKRAGTGAGYIAAGGAIAYGGFLMLLLAAVVGLSYFMWDWLAAFLVGLIVVAVGAVLAYSGYNKIKEINPLPRQTIETLEEDKEWLRSQLK
ncbi:MAG: phage holin family protein [Caldilineaceae bacterium]|nr:phage holin family protein [Caldilineaceae bacterium]